MHSAMRRPNCFRHGDADGRKSVVPSSSPPQVKPSRLSVSSTPVRLPT
ncbi:hypothetical protein GBAR_LOCUS10169 [Geodia barretti]|uniref:Uncharacterized protein n=1 Tax=Geodia barretti TaxID=519541 RepID=A0AA35WJE3_GEOBA|nr:hypothetical protein GBAR_LOCUS10169 [Geodia barretti]